MGAPDLAGSEAYYVSINQLPVAFEPTAENSIGAQVQVLYNMRALAVVAPQGAKPDVRARLVRSVIYQPAPSAGEKELPPKLSGLEVILENKGRRHAMMANIGWRFEGTDFEGKVLRVDVSSEELARAVGTGYVPAMGHRAFIIPIPGFGDGPIKLTFIR